MSELQKNQEKSISKQLDSVLSQLSTDQIRYVVARQECSTDKEAADAIGIKPDTVYHWDDDVKEAVRLMAENGLTTALHVRKRNLAKAMLVKVGGLDSDIDNTRQKVATEIIEWELGKAEIKQDITSDGKPVQVTMIEVIRNQDVDEE